MIGNPLTILDEVDSSNNYATGQALQGLAHHGHAFMALHQTAGRGQRGKTWLTQPGQNLALSIVLDMRQTLISRQFGLSAAVALGVFDFFSHYAGEETRIKWPNDLYWRDRKAVGILLENTIKGQIWQWSIAGIGMNVNQTAFDASFQTKAVSLKQITGRHFELKEVATELCTALQVRFEQFLTGDQNELFKAYNEVLFRKETDVRLIYQQKSYNCRILEVDFSGKLWIEGAPVPYFQFGEVQWQIQPDTL